jgi:hypothetical protein
MFSLEDKVFSHKNAIGKNTQGKTSYLPKAGNISEYLRLLADFFLFRQHG